MKWLPLLTILLGSTVHFACAQDTFSIVAVDVTTGEAGSAGASCVPLDIVFPDGDDDFLGQLFPGVGAINTQAYYLPANQDNAADRMEMGETPSEIIRWLVANDVDGTPEFRQYGIAGFVDGGTDAAAHTGMSTDDYKGHRLGPNYSIQGNILLGPEVLDSMEARFLAAEGDLACKLMAAMQGANMVGADTRCAPYGTSSLFAFLKVAQPGDTPGDPSFRVSVRTAISDGIEPIDSLQVLFDALKDCGPTTSIESSSDVELSVYPNPVSNQLVITSAIAMAERYTIIGLDGVVHTSGIIRDKNTVIEVSNWADGKYFLATPSKQVPFLIINNK